MRWRLCLALIVAAACCGCRGGGEPSAGPAQGDDPQAAPAKSRTPDLRLAVITDLKGYLEPCGCTSRPLGGIDRMAAQLRKLRSQGAPMLVVMAGDLFFDGADYGEAGNAQELRKAETLVDVLNHIGVDVVLPGPRDHAHGDKFLASLRERSRFQWLDGQGLQVSRGAIDVALVAAADDATDDSPQRPNDAELTLGLVVGDRLAAASAARARKADFWIHGGLDEDAPLPPRMASGAWLLHAGRQGQGLLVVDVFRNGPGPYRDVSDWSRQRERERLDAEIARLVERIEAWERAKHVRASDLDAQRGRLQTLRGQRLALEAAPKLSEGNAFSVQYRELDSTSEQDPTVRKILVTHDQAVNAMNREALADLKPEPAGKGEAHYVGSQQCATCHTPAYRWWQTHKHGVAYQTLVDRHKEYNLSCVGCHVTGYDRPGGSTVTHNLNGALVNVGCESCHGPGSKHVTNPTLKLQRQVPETTCVACHNQEHSDQFDYDAYKATLVVPGHGLPADAE